MSADFSSAVAQLQAFNAEQQAAGAGPQVAGLEALVAGVVLGVPKKTWLVPGLREAGCALLRGATEDRLSASRPWRVIPAGSDPTSRALVAVGIAISGEPALAFLGTGSLSYGSTLEAFAEAARLKVPVCFVVGWYGAPGPFATPTSPESLAAAFGLQFARVSGRGEPAGVAEQVAAAVAGVLPGPALVQVDLS